MELFVEPVNGIGCVAAQTTAALAKAGRREGPKERLERHSFLMRSACRAENAPDGHGPV